MLPRDKNNFLVEISPKVMDELNCIYMNSDEEPIVELHYSPYWIKRDPKPATPEGDSKS